MNEMINEVDGVGNPKGAVYSRSELRALLSDFERLEMFTASLQTWMLPRRLQCVSEGVLDLLGRRWEWFLYVKGCKPERR